MFSPISYFSGPLLYIASLDIFSFSVLIGEGILNAVNLKVFTVKEGFSSYFNYRFGYIYFSKFAQFPKAL